jgi:hypothetical protein
MEAGIYYNRYENASGCDSVLITHLSVNPRYEFVTDAEICDNDSILFAGHYIRTAGTYTEILTTGKNCDSVLIMNLDIMETPQVADPT